MTVSHTPTRAIRALLVEHDPADAELCVNALEQAGFSVAYDVANTRDEFLLRIKADRYDIVLADYRLPSWTGMDALATLRSAGLDTPLVLVTGTLGEERAVDCMKQGAADYVLKQNLARLPMTVRRALQEREARVERARSDALIKRLTLAVDQSPSSVIITDLDATIQYVNQRFVHVTGYSQEEALGKKANLLSSGENARGTYADLWKTIRAGQIWRGEIVNRRKNGETYWDDVAISPVRDDAGLVTHYLAIQQDVTERRKTEQALREREERFRQLAENIEEVFFIVNVNFTETLYISPAYEKVWGRTRASLYESPASFLEAVLPEDRPTLMASISRVQHGEVTGRDQFRVGLPNGEVRWVEAQASAVRNEQGQVYRISGVAADITERRNSQTALAESEARLRTIAEASFDGIVFVVGRIIIDANRGLLDMLGYSADEVIGREVTTFVAEESRREVTYRLTQGIPGKFEIVVVHKDGHKLIVEATAQNHMFEGRPGRITALRNVTGQRSLEAQFQHAQKMEAVGRLAGGVAHDFNNLLTVIMSYSELMSPSFSANDPRRDDLEQIRNAAQTAAGLTRQLLAFSRQQVIQPRLIILEEVLTNCKKMLQRLVGEDIEIVDALGEQHSMLMMDPGQLEQVVMNLAVNARDAMPNGGTLTLETTTVNIDSAYVQSHLTATPGHYALVTVRDTGVGMDDATKSRIFEPFFTTKDVGKGTGLGLATVYGIVKQSGGFVWVESELGHGASFKIFLPLARADQTSDEATAPHEVRHGNETILVAEDAPAVRSAVCETLERYGYRVVDAPNGKLALAAAVRHGGPIDLLITDVVMPEMSGRELVERFAVLRPRARILFVSGYANDTAAQYGPIAPDQPFIQKPFSPDALARKVREILDKPRPELRTAK